ncbi:hypothetical protein SLEP1_g58785 [Rubroshorea leprosula]|uniref:Uncharacterized protein n=1 Tax=Rubroshorea leprosula TaxID=152421 RepID=A0AAV5MU27_9ROSI|nr:hypothetical protein SLEP1_g58785 [Rubroshorea leprosula]
MHHTATVSIHRSSSPSSLSSPSGYHPLTDHHSHYRHPHPHQSPSNQKKKKRKKRKDQADLVLGKGKSSAAKKTKCLLSVSFPTLGLTSFLPLYLCFLSPGILQIWFWRESGFCCGQRRLKEEDRRAFRGVTGEFTFSGFILLGNFQNRGFLGEVVKEVVGASSRGWDQSHLIQIHLLLKNLPCLLLSFSVDFPCALLFLVWMFKLVYVCWKMNENQRLFSLFSCHLLVESL